MARLEREGVRGADLVFACIGPALEIFSRYARVETPDGTEKTLASTSKRSGRSSAASLWSRFLVLPKRRLATAALGL
jgi:hypothetical protein